MTVDANYPIDRKLRAMTKKSTSAAEPASFEAAVAELESLVAKMEDGALPLEASLAAYARGATLLKYAQGQLEAAEAKLKVLDGDVLKTLNLNDDSA
jgi:exodeoxyribonuclease VII small subunit